MKCNKNQVKTPPSVSSDVNSVRGNKSSHQKPWKHNLQASQKVKQRQTTVFVSQGNMHIAGVKEQQFSSTWCTHEYISELFVQQLQGWADFPLTKTERGSEGRSHAGNCSTCPTLQLFQIPFYSKRQGLTCCEIPFLPCLSWKRYLPQHAATEWGSRRQHKTKPNICNPCFNIKYLQMLNLYAKII